MRDTYPAAVKDVVRLSVCGRHHCGSGINNGFFVCVFVKGSKFGLICLLCCVVFASLTSFPFEPKTKHVRLYRGDLADFRDLSLEAGTRERTRKSSFTVCPW